MTDHADQLTADTSSGRVRGATDQEVIAFRGIPYGTTDAASRFAPPHPAPDWTGTRDAVEFGPRAPQPDQAALASSSPQAENCLVLNVWTPSCDDAQRPVMVWLHGGGSTGGSGEINAAPLVRRGDVVMVSINHRLGVLGHLHLADLAADAGLDPERFAHSGNVCLLDAVAALEWVRDNIASFGGDPGNVTIFGESGGGGKVGSLLAMPAANGLFHRAIVQSRGPAYRPLTREAATGLAVDVMAELGLGAGDVEALLGADPAALVAAGAAVGERARATGSIWAGTPTVVLDGVDLPASTYDAAAAGTTAPVPLMIGTCREEYALFAAMFQHNMADDGELHAPLVASGATEPEEIVSAYRSNHPTLTSQAMFVLIMSDMNWRMPTLDLASRSAKSSQSIFVYRLDWQSPILGGAPHAADLAFVFDIVDTATTDGTLGPLAALMGYSAADQPVADAMAECWVAFARHGDPNHADVPDWAPFDTANRSTMIFDHESSVVDDPDAADRRIWADRLQPF